MKKNYMKPVVSNYNQTVGLVPAILGVGMVVAKGIGIASGYAASLGAAAFGVAAGAVAGYALAGRTNYDARAASMPMLDAVEMPV